MFSRKPLCLPLSNTQSHRARRSRLLPFSKLSCALQGETLFLKKRSFKNVFVCVLCVHVLRYMCAAVCPWRSEDDSVVSVFSFHLSMGLGTDHQREHHLSPVDHLSPGEILKRVSVLMRSLRLEETICPQYHIWRTREANAQEPAAAWPLWSQPA